MEFGSKFDYYWKQNGHIRHAVSAIQDMCDPTVFRLAKMRNIDDIVVILQAPRRGHFVGAFMMMFAKMDDVYFHIYSSSVFRKQQGWHSDAKITIRFTTEGVQPGQSTREAKNFWECRAAETLEDPLRKHMNCISGYMRKQFKETLPNFQKNIATYAAKMLVEDVGLVDLEWSDNLAAPDELAWEHINYHTKSIRARYQFLLDNSVGPVGDCMDMLRLHCFKTMFSSRSNYFNRHEWVAGRDSGGLARASSEIGA
ncbi:hypothetical protein FoTM2_007039 [Fusarium oxysporum f. sp. vasinfectum]|nr:hypothetical protein FoTM2_007039 [Fusarium oxysporum f. sp. vasinfectum]